MAEVRVIMVVAAQEALRASAALALSARAKKLTKRPEAIPNAVTVDETFAPVPLGRTGYTPRLALATPARSPEFIVRGTVDSKKLESLANAPNVKTFADPRIAVFPTCAGDPAVGAASDVAGAVRAGDLHAGGLDGRKVAIAIMDSGTNIAHLKSVGVQAAIDTNFAWAPSGVATKAGSHPVDHGTMCAYDALIVAPKATLLDFPILQSKTSGGSAMEGFLSDALQAYSYLMQSMREPGWPYRSLVVNNSWGMYHESWDFPKGHPGRYADNPNHPFNTVVGTLVRAGADILFAAGNCGSPCPDGRCEGVTKDTIMGANAHPDVLTVAGATMRKQRVGYSSQGPAIPGMKHTKPDLTAYTHFAGSQAFGTTEPDTGTSAACPVAAGCVAALRSKLPPTTLAPDDLSRELRADAKQPRGADGWNRNYGYGIIEPHETAKRLNLV
jgi:hypothetical protein